MYLKSNIFRKTHENMRTTYVLAVGLAAAAAAALVTGFILSENGIILEDFNYLPGGQSGVKNTMNQNAGSNNNSSAGERQISNDSD